MYEPRLWVAQAACSDLGETSRIFSSGRPHDTKTAKKLCSVCPVARECLDWAMTHFEIGIWGGLDEDEREQLRARRHASVR